MQKLPGRLSAILFGIALFVSIGQSAASAASEWFLLSRHGGCADIEILKRKVPDLGDVKDPYAFIKLMRDKGHQVKVDETSMPNGKVVEVAVPERELSLIFVTAEVCQASGTR